MTRRYKPDCEGTVGSCDLIKECNSSFAAKNEAAGAAVVAVE
jgi:hypothetical protein